MINRFFILIKNTISLCQPFHKRYKKLKQKYNDNDLKNAATHAYLERREHTCELTLVGQDAISVFRCEMDVLIPPLLINSIDSQYVDFIAYIIYTGRLTNREILMVIVIRNCEHILIFYALQ